MRIQGCTKRGENKSYIDLCNHLYVRIKVSYLRGMYDQCYEFARELDGLNIPVGSLFVTEHLFYYSLAISAIYKKAGFSNKVKFRRILSRNHKALKKWAKNCPDNFLHKFYLISAEMSALYGKKEDAILFYDRAISYAKNSSYLLDEAIASELAAKFYVETGDERISRIYIAESCSLYQKWGAISKVDQIKNIYVNIFHVPAREEKQIPRMSEYIAEKDDESKTESAHITDSTTLDIATILKVSQAISGEIDFDNLLKIIMKTALQNSGAQKAFLILEREGKLFVEAEGQADAEEIKILQSLPVEDSKNISQSIVNFVARTGENIVLNNAVESNFVDMYILENRPKSILCTNIGYYGKTSVKVNTILYLENNLTIGAFTPERLEVLRAISTQFAISLENARLYREQQTTVEKLKRLDALKDEFLSNTSHELRTPLLGIIGLADSLIEGATGKLPAKTRENLSLIISSCRRLSGLVNDILDLSRIKNKDLMLQKKPVSLKQIAEVVLVFSKKLTEGKPIELVNNIHSGLPLLYADEDRLTQILYNVIGNAVKFTESGEIKIYANAEVNMNALGNSDYNMAEITVEDTGIGIPENKFEDIFNYFEQGDGSISRKYGGAGLGLSITKELVELHGGSIRVDSKMGSGPRSVFTLPVYSQETDVSEPEKSFDEASANNLTDTFNFHQRASLPAEKNLIDVNDAAFSSVGNNTSATILIVDDEVLNLRVLNYQLGLAGYNVTSVDSGAGAIELLEKEKLPDIVLLDIMMPDMSGYEVCSELRKRYSLYELPVLMVTAKNQVMDTVAGFEAGANDFLSKPFDRRELLARVNTLITLKRTVKEYEESKFKNLHNRMNPHFLFNSIHAIHSLIRSNPGKADEGLIKLAEIYRYLMDTSLSSVVEFEKEWSFVKSYLEFEKIRFADVLTYKIELSGEFGDILIPPLSIQPLVENSVKHGLRQKMQLGVVEIFAERKDKFVKIIVADDGTSIKTKNIFTRSLGNIKDRLKFNFKESDLKLENREQGGVVATMTFTVGDR